MTDNNLKNLPLGTSDFAALRLANEIYVDKTDLVYELASKRRKYFLARPRRFGKSMGVDMLAAYYDRSVNTKELFQSLKIKSTKDYEKHLNQYDVLKINMQEFLSLSGTIEEMLRDYLLLDSNFMI